jgi:HlyD family secretion protein
MTCSRIVACAVVMALLGGIVLTQEVTREKRPALSGPGPSADTKATGHKVEKKPFRIELTVKGILEGEETAEISYRPQLQVQPPPSQGPLTIKFIADHGARVKKGDALAAFDTHKIDEVIHDLEVEQKVHEAGIKLAEQELPLFQKSVPVDLAAAERAKKLADDELKYFREVSRPQSEKMADFMLTSARFYLEFAEEELRQLEKMYKANDLTEDTEKIILKRQRHMVESERRYLESAILLRDRTLKFTLPNREKTLAEDQLRQTLSLEKTRNTLGPTVIQKKEALVKMHFDHAKILQRLAKIRQDRSAMTVLAPIDGIVYHGKFHKGQWSLADALASKLAPHGTVSPDEVFLTVVKPGPLMVHVTIDEKDVHLLKPGAKGKAKLLVNPDRKLPARLAKLSTLPAAPGKFDALVALETDGNDTEFMPGMACSIKFVPYSKKGALTVPSKAVREQDEQWFVYVLKNGAEHKRTVTPGRTDGERTEILAGLQEGEEVKGALP